MKLAICILTLSFAIQNSDQEKDPLKEAIIEVGKQKSYSAKFSIKMSLPDSEIVVDGNALKVAPDMLYMYYKASGGKYENIIKKGNQVKMYHELAGEWFDSDEKGMPEAARGIQNPDEVMEFILKYTAKAEKTDMKEIWVFNLNLPPESMMELFKGHTVDDVEVNWAESKLSIKIEVDKKKGLIKRVEAASTLSGAKKFEGKKMNYIVIVDMTDYNKDFDFKFYGRDKKEIKVPSNLFDKNK